VAERVDEEGPGGVGIDDMTETHAVTAASHQVGFIGPKVASPRPRTPMETTIWLH
jgi:hypothetical protein